MLEAPLADVGPKERDKIEGKEERVMDGDGSRRGGVWKGT